MQGSALEFVVQTLATFALYKSPGEHPEIPIKAVDLTLLLNYNLLAVTSEDVEEALDAMYEAYMTNLSPYTSAVLVSATGDPKLKTFELTQRDNLRSKIKHVLRNEGIALIECRYGEIDATRLECVWRPYVGMDKEQFLKFTLDSVCNHFAKEFMVIHRVSRILKKCGQYQDLMLLSKGDQYAYTYTDKTLYGSKARKFNELLFHDCDDVKNILGRNFQYTFVLDSDTRVPPATALQLMVLAKENPNAAIIQPSIKLSAGNNDTIYMHLESLRQQLNEPITNAMAELLGQSGFYGKALIKNELYIERVLGTRENLIERVPIDVLSHDTFEAAVLKPLYAGSLTLYEAPSFNFVTWDIRETRWNRGEVILSMYFWEKWVGRPLRFLQKSFQGDFVETKLRTESKLSFVSSYVAHSALRQMFMKPALLLYIILQMRVTLYHTYLPICIMLFIVVVFPKLAIATCYNIHWIIIETISSVLQFTPEAIVGCVRIYQAYKEHVFKNCCWVPQRVVEDEFRKSNPMLITLKHTWGYSVLAFFIILLIAAFMPLNLFTHFLFCTVLILPIYAGILSFSMSFNIAKPENPQSNPDPDSIV